jgi:hypothetical protein
MREQKESGLFALSLPRAGLPAVSGTEKSPDTFSTDESSCEKLADVSVFGINFCHEA